MTPTSITEWINYLKDKPIPVLGHTLMELGTVYRNDDAPVKALVNIVEQDPGLTAQLLRQCNHTDGHSLDREITSLQQAIMLVGTQRLAKIANELPKLEKNYPQATREQLMRTFCRAYHAGRQAVAWAHQRRDMTPDEVFAATQLHFLGEMVLAIHAPEQLLAAFKLRKEKNISSEEAQYLALGFTLDQLSLALAQAWQLPQLVIEALQAENAKNPRGFGIMLAVQLARTAAIDWYSDKMLSIYEYVSELVKQPIDNICHQAHQLAVQVARQLDYYHVMHAAALLPLIRSDDNKVSITQSVAQDYQADICLTPQLSVLKTTLDQLRSAVKDKQDDQQILNICLQGLHDGIGLNRVVFATPDTENANLTATAIIGADNDPVFSRFNVKLSEGQLFKLLLQRSQAVCINDKNREQYWSLVPEEFQKLIGTNSFMAMSIFLDNQPSGIMYADRHTSSCQVDQSSYEYFKKMCRSFSDAIKLSKAQE